MPRCRESACFGSDSGQGHAIAATHHQKARCFPSRILFPVFLPSHAPAISARRYATCCQLAPANLARVRAALGLRRLVNHATAFVDRSARVLDRCIDVFPQRLCARIELASAHAFTEFLQPVSLFRVTRITLPFQIAAPGVRLVAIFVSDDKPRTKCCVRWPLLALRATSRASRPALWRVRSPALLSVGDLFDRLNPSVTASHSTLLKHQPQEHDCATADCPRHPRRHRVAVDVRPEPLLIGIPALLSR